ncbi:MAG TPA: hypothetical protein VFB79_09715 [Candidatus Angelobacter sp.]|nr:hypothetical protein [Candidatus Angelobacter sp.]
MKTYETPQIFEVGAGSKLIQGAIPPNPSDHVGAFHLPPDIDLTMLDE